MAHVPGLKVVYSSTPADAKGLLLSAIFDPDPVIVVEEMGLYWMKGEAPEGDHRVPLGAARVVRPGDDATVVAYGSAVYAALQAAGELEAEGASVEVVDLRSLVPLDREAVLASVKKTGRLVTVHDANRFCGYGAELAAMVAEEAFEQLRAPVRRVAAPDAPVPFSQPQEQYYKPDAAQVAAALRSIL
jgi:pyruvate dehydrogenase E1 component beta subunit